MIAVGRIIFVQPAVPTYRIAFFELLCANFGPRISVYASKGDLGVLTDERASHEWQAPLGEMKSILPGLQWQAGALQISIERGDILVVSGAPRCLSNLALLAKGRLKGARVIWWGHYWSSTSRLWTAGIRFALMSFAHAMLFYTDREVAVYRQRTLRPRPAFALNNGIDTRLIEARRASYRSCERRRAVLFIGRITEKTDLGVLISAAALEACAGLNVHIIGDGPSRQKFSKMARALGLDDRIIWHGATTDENQIAAVANMCLAFAFPGACGLSLIHAMAYGLPAIVHDDRATQGPEVDALVDGGNGRLFHKGDPADLARVLADTLANPELLDQMAAEALDTTRRSFNVADMAGRFCRIVEALN